MQRCYLVPAVSRVSERRRSALVSQAKKQVALVLVVMHDVTPLDAVQQYSSYTLIDIKQNKIVYAIPI